MISAGLIAALVLALVVIQGISLHRTPYNGPPNVSVIPVGEMWRQLAVGPDLPKAQRTPQLSGQPWPNGGANYGVQAEGIVFDYDGNLYVCDHYQPGFAQLQPTQPPSNQVVAGFIWKLDASTHEWTNFAEGPGTTGLHIYAAGDKIFNRYMLLACDIEARRIVWFDTRTAVMTVIASSYNGQALQGPDDLTVSPTGQVYFSDSDYGSQNTPAGPNAVYRLDPTPNADGTFSFTITQIITNLAKPNGIEITPDGKTMFVFDLEVPIAPNADVFSPLAVGNGGSGYDIYGMTLDNGARPTPGLYSGGIIARYDLNAAGEIVYKDGTVSPENSMQTAGRAIASRSNVGCDGGAMDTEGNLYVAWHNAANLFPSPYENITQFIYNAFNNQRGEITVYNKWGYEIDNLTPYMAELPPIRTPDGPPFHLAEMEFVGQQVTNFMPVNLAFGKGRWKNHLFMGRFAPWGVYRILTNKVGYS